MKINKGLRAYSDYNHNVKLDGGPTEHDIKMFNEGIKYQKNINNKIFLGACGTINLTSKVLETIVQYKIYKNRLIKK